MVVCCPGDSERSRPNRTTAIRAGRSQPLDRKEPQQSDGDAAHHDISETVIVNNDIESPQDDREDKGCCDATDRQGPAQNFVKDYGQQTIPKPHSITARFRHHGHFTKFGGTLDYPRRWPGLANSVS